MTKEVVINKLVEEIKKMPNGTEVCIATLFEEIYNISGKQLSELKDFNLFDIYYGVTEKLSEFKIELDHSRFAGQIVGLPYNLPLSVKR